MREQRRQGARRSDRHGQGITAASNGGDLFESAPTSQEDAGEVSAREVRLFHDGACVACHERLPGRLGVAARLDHYLELLRERPGALKGSLALHQEREAGRWPATFDRLSRALEGRHGTSEAARQMVEVLLLCRERGPARVELAARGALACGALAGRAVAVLARRGERAAPEPLTGLPAALARTARPEPDLLGYDALIGGSR